MNRGPRIVGWLSGILGPIFALVAVAGLCLLLPLWLPVVMGIFFWVTLVRKSKGSPWHAFRAYWGWGRSPRKLAKLLGMTVEELQVFTPTYRTAKIPKRNGTSRTLHIPDDETRRLQRAVLHVILARLRAHPAAVGFERDKSIVDNARRHTKRQVVIKLDVVDFFPRTTTERVEAYFRRVGWNRAAAGILARFTTWEGGLPQGAPTSPRLSNLVNYGLDVRLAGFAKKRKGHYTRYADDITFSFPKDYPRRVRGVVQLTRRVLRHYGYKLNERKTRILRRHQRQVVTGLVVNDRVGLPRELRRKLRAARHHLRTGREASWTAEQLKGWESLEKMIEAQRAPK